MSLQYSSKLGITTEHLLEINKRSLDVLSEIDYVTNQLILDLYDFKEGNSTCTYQTVGKWLGQLYKNRWPDSGTSTPQFFDNQLKTQRKTVLFKMRCS